MVASPQFELVRSGHYEFNPGHHEVYPIVAGTYEILADADYVAGTEGFLQIGNWPTRYLTATWYASAAAGGVRTFTIQYDRYGSIVNDLITGTPGDISDTNVAALFTLIGSQGVTSDTQLIYTVTQGPSTDYASLTLSGQTWGLADMRANCLQLLNSADFRQTTPDTYIQVNYVIDKGGGGVPTLYSPATDVYIWGLGSGGTVFGSAPPPSPRATTIIKTFGNAPVQPPNAGSNYGLDGPSWHMQKSYVVHPGFTLFFYNDLYSRNPGTPPSPDSGSLPGVGSWLLTPIGTLVDTPADTSQISASGGRFFDHLA